MRKFTPPRLRNLDHKPAQDIVCLEIALGLQGWGLRQSVQAHVTA